MGRMDGQTHHINGMHALIKFPEYILYGLGVMAQTPSGTYGRTDGTVVWVVLLFYVHGKHLRSCRDGQLT